MWGECSRRKQELSSRTASIGAPSGLPHLPANVRRVFRVDALPVDGSTCILQRDPAILPAAAGLKMLRGGGLVRMAAVRQLETSDCAEVVGFMTSGPGPRGTQSPTFARRFVSEATGGQLPAFLLRGRRWRAGSSEPRSGWTTGSCPFGVYRSDRNEMSLAEASQADTVPCHTQ